MCFPLNLFAGSVVPRYTNRAKDSQRQLLWLKRRDEAEAEVSAAASYLEVRQENSPGKHPMRIQNRTWPVAPSRGLAISLIIGILGRLSTQPPKDELGYLLSSNHPITR